MNILLGYRPSCIGRIVELHASYYSRTAGFGVSFEAKVASGLAAFCLGYQEGRDGLWLAEQDGVFHGSIAIDGSHHETTGAHLRWFITSDASRGQGTGSQLVTAALDFCEAQGYRQVHLWTFEGLLAARHLYEKHGFALAQSQQGSQWGKEVTEQLFVKKLGP